MAKPSASRKPQRKSGAGNRAGRSAAKSKAAVPKTVKSAKSSPSRKPPVADRRPPPKAKAKLVVAPAMRSVAPAAPKAPPVDPRPKGLNPPDVAPPVTRYSLGVVYGAGGRRLLISGQVGIRPDGSTVDGLEGQWDQAFANLLAVLRAAGMTPANVVKLVAFSRVPRTVTVFRAARDKVFTSDPPPASTYLEVTGLAAPGFLCEVEAEAVAFD